MRLDFGAPLTFKLQCERLECLTAGVRCTALRPVKSRTRPDGGPHILISIVMQGFTARGDEQLPVRAFSAWRALIGTAHRCGALRPRLPLLMQPICHAFMNDSRQSILQVL